MQVERVYSRNLVTTTRTASLMEAAQLMRHFHVGALVVTDDAADTRRAIGIVTDRDLVLQAMANGVGPRDAAVAEVMTEGLASVRNNVDIFEAIEAMRANGVRRLAVSGPDGAVLGIVSYDDVIAAMGVEMGSLAAVLSTELKSEREIGQRAPVMVPIG
jgi:signal-transduction protein with cAMP-binding, CBS, and nucleotidyltransferase domain